jgi:HMG box factor
VVGLLITNGKPFGCAFGCGDGAEKFDGGRYPDPLLGVNGVMGTHQGREKDPNPVPKSAKTDHDPRSRQRHWEEPGTLVGSWQAIWVCIWVW